MVYSTAQYFEKRINNLEQQLAELKLQIKKLKDEHNENIQQGAR